MRYFLLSLLLAASAAFAQLAPFNPGPTVATVLTGSAQTVTLPRIQKPGPLWQYVITSTAAPASGCTQPTFYTTDGTTATTSNGMPVLPNSAFLVTFPTALTTISVIGADVGCTFYVTTGVGQ